MRHNRLEIGRITRPRTLSFVEKLNLGRQVWNAFGTAIHNRTQFSPHVWISSVGPVFAFSLIEKKLKFPQLLTEPSTP